MYRWILQSLKPSEKLNAFYKEQQLQNHVFYFAVAPRFFAVIAKGLEQVEKACRGKVIIEKPFGEDAGICQSPEYEDLERFFTKESAFSISTEKFTWEKKWCGNMQAIRFMNPIFQDVWNANYIEHVQISAMETVGVENRGGYYDQAVL
ncbi:MAG: hypothetical protein ACLTDX_02215 [[Clostridium] innocuum]